MNEIQESGDGQSEVSEVSRQLETATFEPEARVENRDPYQQAEAIEDAVATLVTRTELSAEAREEAASPEGGRIKMEQSDTGREPVDSAQEDEGDLRLVMLQSELNSKQNKVQGLTSKVDKPTDTEASIIRNLK
jgi:hypothetical protein